MQNNRIEVYTLSLIPSRKVNNRLHVGSSPTASTKQMGLYLVLTAMHLLRDKQWAYTVNSKTNKRREC